MGKWELFAFFLFFLLFFYAAAIGVRCGKLDTNPIVLSLDRSRLVNISTCGISRAQVKDEFLESAVPECRKQKGHSGVVSDVWWPFVLLCGDLRQHMTARLDKSVRHI